jgi:MFS family permease
MALTSASGASPASAATAPRWLDVYIKALARAVSQCGDLLAATALALILQGRGEGGLAVAGILLAAAVPVTVAGPFAGRIADRVDSRTLLVTAGLAQAGLCVVLAFASQPVVLIGLVAVLSCGVAITSPTLAALTPLMVGRENLARASAISQTASTIGMLTAPALGGILVGAFGSRLPLLIDAATYLAIPAAGLLIRTRRGGRFRAQAATQAAASGGRQPVFRLRSDALLWPMFIMVGAVIAAIGAVDVVDVFFVRDTLHSSSAGYGLIGAVWLGGMVIGALAWSRQRTSDLGTARAMVVACAATSVVMGAAGLVPDIGWLVPAWLLGGALNGAENVQIGVMLGSRVRPEVRGHASAMVNSIAGGANAFGFLLGGALLTIASPRTLIVACGLAGLAVVGIFSPPLVRAIRREQHAMAAEPAAPAGRGVSGACPGAPTC